MTQVIKVENVPAAQLVPILRPLVPQQGHLAAYAATNTLIVTDRASNIQRLFPSFEGIDRPDNEEVEVIRCGTHQPVKSFEFWVHCNHVQDKAPVHRARFDLQRMNARTAFCSVVIKPARVRMRGLIANLDTPVESGGNTRVVYLRFANAPDLLAILHGRIRWTGKNWHQLIK